MHIEALRDFCLALPYITEDVKWGNLCFMIEEKIFIIISLEGKNQFAVKCDVENFDALTENPAINQAYHLAKRHWIQVENFDNFPDDQIKDLIIRSRQLVLAKLPKKVQQKYL